MLLIVILALLIGFAFWGYKQGILKIAVSIISLIASILITTIFAPIITKAIKENTQIDEKISDVIYEMLDENESVNQYLSSNEVANQTIDTSTVSQFYTKLNDIVNQIGEKFELPSAIVNALDNNSATDVLETMTEYEITSVREITLRLAAKSLGNVVFNALIYIIILVVLTIVFKSLVIFTNMLERIPIVNKTDDVLGAFLGLCEGLIAVWLLFILITAFGNIEFASNLLLQIGDNKFLSFIYNNNPLNYLLLVRIQ